MALSIVAMGGTDSRPLGVIVGAELSASESRGFQCRNDTDKTGKSHGYVVFVPQKYRDGEKLPVLMFLNGTGENGNDGVQQISNNFGVRVWDMQRFFPFLAFAPQCRESWALGGSDMRRALEILDSLIEEFGADPDRVNLTGVSAGGNAVWDIASAHPERFGAIIPLCAGGGGDPRRLVEAAVPSWSFCNRHDTTEIVDFNRLRRAQLIEMGQCPQLTEYPERGHDCWNRAYQCTAMYAWLAKQSRAGNKAEGPFEYLPAQRLVREWRSEGGGEWRVEGDAMVLGCVTWRKMEDGGSNGTGRRSTEYRVQSTQYAVPSGK